MGLYGVVFSITLMVIFTWLLRRCWVEFRSSMPGPRTSLLAKQIYLGKFMLGLSIFMLGFNLSFNLIEIYILGMVLYFGCCVLIVHRGDKTLRNEWAKAMIYYGIGWPVWSCLMLWNYLTDCYRFKGVHF